MAQHPQSSEEDSRAESDAGLSSLLNATPSLAPEGVVPFLDSENEWEAYSIEAAQEFAREWRKRGAKPFFNTIREGPPNDG